MFSKVFSLILLASATLAATIPNIHPFTNLHSRAAGDMAAQMLLEIAPSSSSCVSTNSECRTNIQAAPYLIQAFIDYKITNVHEMAAVLALVAFESVSFQFNTNQAGTAGQGTRNMQMFNYNYLYASSIPALQSQVTSIASSASSATTAQQNAIRALVLPDTYAWASAAWFLTTQCSSTIRQSLQAGGSAGWQAYISQCVGTTVTAERTAFWTAANTAFGIS